MVGAPPVVRLITQFERCFMIFRNGAKASGLWSGWPVFGLRACRCTIAAPASAASTAASAISCGVTGNAFDIEGVWIAPVTAQVMMTLRLMLFALFLAVDALIICRFGQPCARPAPQVARCAAVSAGRCARVSAGAATPPSPGQHLSYGILQARRQSTDTTLIAVDREHSTRDVVD